MRKSTHAFDILRQVLQAGAGQVVVAVKAAVAMGASAALTDRVRVVAVVVVAVVAATVAAIDQSPVFP